MESSGQQAILHATSPFALPLDGGLGTLFKHPKDQPSPERVISSFISFEPIAIMNFRLIAFFVSLTILIPAGAQDNFSLISTELSVHQSQVKKKPQREKASEATSDEKANNQSASTDFSPRGGKTFSLPTTVEADSSLLELNHRPPLVIGITVDQMRMDYLYRYWEHFGADGFKRLLQHGMVCADHHFGYAPTYTGPGHASIFTGTTPRFHGVISNYWFDRKSGKTVYCASDTSVQTVGLSDGTLSAGQMSPHRMHASTLGDELKLATDLKAKVFGISLKDRGAILPAGHLADGAFWFYGQDEGKFISSTYYMDALPKWLVRWNSKNLAQRYMNSTWTPFLPESAYSQSWPDNNPYESSFNGTSRPTFPYNLEELKAQNGGFDLLKETPHGNSLLVDLAIRLIENEDLGQDAITDLLALSFSSTDYIGHRFGAHAWETQDVYVRLDRELARLFKTLDDEVGAGQWLCWLTADHGGATVPSLAAAEGMPVDYWKPGNMTEDVETALFERYGEGKWMLRYSNNQFILNRPLLREKGHDLAAMQSFVQGVCLETPGVLMAPTAHDLARSGASADEIMERLRMGYHSAFSGDVLVVPEPGWIKYGRSGTDHGSPFPYDTHVPCVFYGWNVPTGITYDRTHIRDIAPTVASMIHAPLPNASTGRPIKAVLEHE